MPLPVSILKKYFFLLLYVFRKGQTMVKTKQELRL